MATPEEGAADQFIRSFKEHLRPCLVREIPDDLFQPGHEAELGKRVEGIVDARLVRDKVPIGRKLRIQLIESLMTDISLAKKERFALASVTSFPSLGTR
jgi:hypothetical protein